VRTSLGAAELFAIIKSRKIGGEPWLSAEWTKARTIEEENARPGPPPQLRVETWLIRSPTHAAVISDADCLPQRRCALNELH